MRMEGFHGADMLVVGQNVHVPSILRGGNGNDLLVGSGDPSILIGDAGSDLLVGRSDSDISIGGMITLDDAALANVLVVWSSNRPYNQRVANLRATLNAGTALDDLAVDWLFGGGSRDWFFASLGDPVLGRTRGEFVNQWSIERRRARKGACLIHSGGAERRRAHQGLGADKLVPRRRTIDHQL